MKKKFLAATLVFFAALGSAFGKEKIFHAETKFFDIIFDENAIDSAREIYDCADKTLEELCLQYKVEPDFKIPVVITSRTENFNAYFTNYNYNHIVLYSTSPEESLMNYENSIRSVFVHELNHLVSINSKNGFWKGFGKIFGDIYNPGDYITLTTFFKEGASVAEESKNGEGRLNDGFFLHNIRQAKLSGKFPGYTDCFGARTIYPYGTTSYLFGSAFTEYIIEKYGMDKYAEFWHRGINSNRLTSTAVFKKTYGISMKKEWEKFHDSINVEGIEKDPSNLKGIEKSGFRNKSLHLYSVLGIKDGKEIVLDETNGTVYFGKKKLFTNAYLVSARLSDNGKYIGAIFFDTNHLETKIRAAVMDVETGSWKKLEETGIKQICVFESNGKKYIATVKNLSQQCSLEIRLFDRENEILCSTEFAAGEIPYSLSSDGNGNIWFLFKSGLNFSLYRACFNEGKIDTYEFSLGKIKPEQLSICSNVGKTTALFSYAEQKSFPRLAVAEINGDEAKIEFFQKDVSGGIYSPVMKNGKILYAARFYTEGAVYEMTPDEFKNEATILTSSVNGIKRHDADTAEKTGGDFSFSEYRKFLYGKQTIIPFSILNSYYISPSVYYSDEKDCLGQGSSYLLGLTVLKNNPWDTRHIVFTAGYSPEKKAGGIGLTFLGNTSSGNFNFTDTVNSIFNRDGFLQATNDLSCSLELVSGDISRIILSESNFLLYGKEDMDSKTAEKYFLDERHLDKDYLYDKNTISLYYTNLRRTGARTHEISGVKLGMNFKNVYATAFAEKQDSIFYRMIHYENDRIQFAQLFPSAEISIPFILPFDCKGPFTYNLPVRAYGSLFQYNNTLLTFNTEAALFSWEVQKGFGAVPLYLGTLTLKAFYQEEYNTGLNRNMEIRYLQEDLKNMGNMDKTRYAGGSLSFILGGNTGALADRNINASISCMAFRCLEGNHKGESKFLVTSALNFSLF